MTKTKTIYVSAELLDKQLGLVLNHIDRGSVDAGLYDGLCDLLGDCEHWLEKGSDVLLVERSDA